MIKIRWADSVFPWIWKFTNVFQDHELSPVLSRLTSVVHSKYMFSTYKWNLKDWSQQFAILRKLDHNIE